KKERRSMPWLPIISSPSGFGRQFRQTSARQCPFEFVDGLNVVYQTGRSRTGAYPSRHFSFNMKKLPEKLSPLFERRNPEGQKSRAEIPNRLASQDGPN